MDKGRRGGRWIAILLALVFAWAGLAPAGGGTPADVGQGPRLVHLEPGLAVNGATLRGWTERVIRSVPRLASGDLDTLPSSAASTATLFRSVIAADVVAHGASHELARIGVGNAVPVGKRELVVTPDGPKEALATLGIVERVVLKEAEAQLLKARLVARTPTFALIRAPSFLVVDGKHKTIDLSYAMLVDPHSGALTTFLWATPAGIRKTPDVIFELPRGLVCNDALDVKATRWLGPLPVMWSFAMSSLPPGRPIKIADGLGRMIADAKANPVPLELALRTLIAPTRRP